MTYARGAGPSKPSQYGAVEALGPEGLGGIDREVLRDVLNVPAHLNIVMLVALGYSAEKQVVETAKDGQITYWLDDAGVIHVPKRPIEEILQWNACTN